MENEAHSNRHPNVGAKRPVSAISQHAPPAGTPTTQSSGSSPPMPSAPSGASVPGPSSAGSVANGGGAETSGSEPKSRNHGKAAYGPDMAIIEVTNDGIPENMEMIIHLKVRTGACVVLFMQRCTCLCCDRVEGCVDWNRVYLSHDTLALWVWVL